MIYLRKVCEIQRNYIDGKISKEIYQRQIDDANCTYIFYLKAETEKLKLEKAQMDIMIHFSKLLNHEKNNDN